MAILGASTVTNTGSSVITGNVAVTPGSAITGFPPGVIVGGAQHVNDTIATQARAGALAAYTRLAAERPTRNLTGTDLGGLTLTPGIYRFSSSAQLTGTLRLDTQGNSNAVFHFLIGSTLTAASGSRITLLNGGCVNLFWQVGTSATIGTTSVFLGNIIADQSITLQTGATLEGRALALNGAVTLDTNAVTPPPPCPEPTPSSPPVPIGLIFPTDLTIISTIDVVISDIQMDNVIDRMMDLHQGVPISTNKLTVIDRKDVPSDGKEVLSDGKEVLSGGKEVLDQRDDSRRRPSIVSDKRWGFFITGSGEMVDVESTSTAQGTSFETGGVTVGADYRLSDNLTIGAAFGYANTETDLNFGGHVRSNNGTASIYATYYKGGFYVDGVAAAGIGSIDTRRLTVGGVTRGDADTTTFVGLLGTGYDWRIGNLSFGPVASLRFARASIDSFHEGDAFGSLYINRHDQDSLRSAVGLQASYHAQFGRVPVTPFVRAQWQHEYLDDTASLNTSFDNRNTFDIDGPRLGRDGLRLDAGLSAQITPRIGVFAFYSNELGRQNYTSQSVSGGVRMSF